MRKVFLIVMVFLAGFVAVNFAADETKPSSPEQVKSQALWVAQVLSSKNSTSEERALALTYVDHVMGSIEGYRPDLFKKLYPNQSRLDIIQNVISFYQNNPLERHRKVADVLLNGAKAG
ncbi:MAG: hypothetical protein A3G33_04800 [Omnitrophica bacterium RIFCSPLOWO2_12_FULL_44_17]|uniref:Uncharacterized protein n=1 Tax=Candidatus Danuiimicrobium aquiferis TaxID=1801832 RepID=A0A1G1KQY2_9BACT|nr:MAG: hypothetical protein A3B72_11010 [Omnitrophica bacterium RIFCSPHIGHO2_02_FULL_45_28]OGW92474.1 MAG: hypothetical protein A3E74_06850 [Omnitrophica bacterium RIFCSPHIGHO2_12_FULL_44_12]OGW95252.1 MAG: hypothetical protein A3G33_04800 [Omnitrophica bacterium RIFCSPLOWO2_12_FULL_44_17]OGX02347.1 MAG: hypothetical protein A3J12_10135 [Omnitrophica bacterium RIFCSPLOWO2_02_FULL_44_11]